MRRLVEQQDAERPVVDQPFGQARDACEQRIEIEDRRHLASDLGERLERVHVMTFALEEPRVLECNGDVCGKLPQQRFVLRREGAFDLVEQVQRANHFAFAPDRHRQLRQHVAQGPLVSRLTANIVDENRPAFLDGGTHDAFTKRQTQCRPAPPPGSRRRRRCADLAGVRRADRRRTR